MISVSPFRWRVVLAVAGLAGAPRALEAETAVPPPAAAYIQQLTGAPGRPQVVLAATQGAGLLRTRDGGDRWESIGPAAGLTQFNVVVRVPGTARGIYAGGAGTGLWFSADEGATWARSPAAPEDVLDVAPDPTNAERLFLLAPDGVYRSTTGWAGTWERVFDYGGFVRGRPELPWPGDFAVRFSRFQHLTVDPRQPDTVFLGARWEGGYHRSDDGGETWRHEAVGPLFRRVDQVWVDPVRPELLYAGTHHQGLFRSFNRGRSWVSSSHGLAPQQRTPHYGAVLISGLAFDPGDPAILFSGSDQSNWKSTDGGRSWAGVGPTLSCEFARSFLVTPAAVYAGTNVGIFRSRDGGATWESCNRGLPERRIVATARGEVAGEAYAFAVCAGRPAVFRRSLATGGDWVSVSWMLNSTASAVRFEEATGTVVIDTPAGERRSTDGGLRWDVPPTVYARKPVIAPAAPTGRAAASAGMVNLAVEIRGAPRPDDALVDVWYRRPPYVSLELVGQGYPEDGGVPRWSGAWAGELAGVIAVPTALLDEAADLRLRVEVRDFQYGTRVGAAPLNRAGTTVVPVSL